MMRNNKILITRLTFLGALILWIVGIGLICIGLGKSSSKPSPWTITQGGRTAVLSEKESEEMTELLDRYFVGTDGKKLNIGETERKALARQRTSALLYCLLGITLLAIGIVSLIVSLVYLRKRSYLPQAIEVEQ